MALMFSHTRDDIYDQVHGAKQAEALAALDALQKEFSQISKIQDPMDWSAARDDIRLKVAGLYTKYNMVDEENNNSD